MSVEIRTKREEIRPVRFEVSKGVERRPQACRPAGSCFRGGRQNKDQDACPVISGLMAQHREFHWSQFVIMLHRYIPLRDI
jgi:hypothetical protein